MANGLFRILVVDDHELIRQGVRSLFSNNSEFVVCGEATDGRAAIQQVQKLNPDLVLLDISMPVMGGLEAASEIRRVAPKTKIVILTMHNSDQVRRQAQNAGAQGFVTKSDISRTLLETMKGVLAS